MATQTTMLETARDRVAGRVAAARGVEVSAFDPALLTLIAEAVLLVVERCLDGGTEAEVAARMRSPGLLERLAVRRRVREILRETYGPLGFLRHGGADLAEALLAAGSEADDAERLALMREVASGSVGR